MSETDPKPELDEKTLEEWRRNADGFGLFREMRLIDAFRAARQELASTQSDLEFEKSERRSTTVTLRERITELEQQSQRDRERIEKLEKLLKWLDEMGGLGLDKHAMIRAVLDGKDLGGLKGGA